ncbi:MAG: sugar nucleotide-binding protein [Acidobacteriales bacterium]|nr:sugar nucleotide-binding protein [Terriglobales bacterium]
MSDAEFHLVPRSLQLWGGVECTTNRVADSYLEQTSRSGHIGRLSDFDRFAELGITALRHGVLWEQTAPGDVSAADWRWADASLAKIQQLGITPIVGLLHHGSGPRSTSLVDAGFPEKLAAYASAVAQRYPWISDYTPVNEPLTTARFSGLYGLWYPHGRDDQTFVRALLNECRATVLAMRAIRLVNPYARLIQTDDLGKTHSTPKLAYQADFENERRWLAFDLLGGRVNPQHPMWGYLISAGSAPSELEWFLDNPCPPDVIGVNHYLSGERFLDEHLDRYPDHTHGGNGRDSYADVLANRVLREGAAGPYALLMEAWNRYQLPVAVTECHNGCTREEQLRWFAEVWDAAETARRDGAKVIAVTAWSLLGAFDWDSLVTRNEGHYEPGVFDLRSTPPRATALASLARQLQSGASLEHPLLRVPGWWHRAQRFVYGISVDHQGEASRQVTSSANVRSTSVRPLLITGGGGTLGRAFARICEHRGIPYALLTRQQCDIADVHSVRKALFQFRPWAIINTAGYVRVDQAELDYARCYRENTSGAAVLAAECAAHGIQLLTFSSDLVFAGEVTRPYVEGDPVNPLSQYGSSKAAAELKVLNLLPSALIVRTSTFFGPWDEYNFITIALRTLAADREFRAAQDNRISPTYVPDLVNTSLDLLIDGESGIWHLANQGETAWADLAQNVADRARISTVSLERCSAHELGRAARRPLYSVLGSQRALLMPTLEHALDRFFQEAEFDWGIQPKAA